MDIYVDCYKDFHNIRDAIIFALKGACLIKRKTMSYNKGFRYVAYDAGYGEYQEFKTKEDAEKWLKENDYEGISEEAVEGKNYIAEIQYKSVVDVIDEKSNYHVHTDKCSENCDEEEWPYSDDFDWIGNHHYERINWEE